MEHYVLLEFITSAVTTFYNVHEGIRQDALILSKCCCRTPRARAGTARDRSSVQILMRYQQLASELLQLSSQLPLHPAGQEHTHVIG